MSPGIPRQPSPRNRHRGTGSRGHGDLRRLRGACLYLGLLVGAPSLNAETGLAPMADVHVHFNWTHEEVITPEEAVERLRARNVTLAVVFSTPSDNAMKLREVAGPWVIPFYTPYVSPRVRETWYVHEPVPGRVRAALASGKYHGIGELHLMDGLGPRRDNPIFLELVALAREFDVPMLIHTDSSTHRYFRPVCSNNPEVRFLWAHAGGTLQPTEVGRLLEVCPNVWVELSARDPWHYGGITGSDGALLPAWAALLQRSPTRFMVGTDPVWNAHQIHRWWEADEGWDHYAQLNAYHRDWLRHLPADIELQVRLTNAQRFFGVEGSRPAIGPRPASSD